MTTREKANQLKFDFGDKAIMVAEEVIKQLSEIIDPEYMSFWHGEEAGQTLEGNELQDWWNEVRGELQNDKLLANTNPGFKKT